jgi:4-aminobutyrate aminotransferase
VAGSAFDGVEGDLNVSPRRAEWNRRQIDDETRRWLEEDARYFLHQALSTPCLNALARADSRSR